MSLDLSATESVPTEKIALEKLVTFCQQLAHTYSQIRTLTGAERSNVDKTLAKASRYELLRKVNPAAGACYSEQQVEQIQIECLHEINNRLIATGQLVNETANDFYKLQHIYQDLQHTAQQLDWSRETASSLISGNEKRKPLEYYLQHGFRIVYQLNMVVSQIKLVFGAVDIQRIGSIQKLRDCLKISEELDLYLREFVTYTAFIVK
ncbi:AAEL016969-PA [Aedes aegypti]|uniref:AAEL016969-PA n=1 Tax=Aedes aegypti TaxID=7159 RepID=J9HFA7_AEDAE|nr:AAEL016969-PA [Aedes aegypti]